MCARFVFYSGRSFGDEFGSVALPDLTPRYNIAPTQFVLGITNGEKGREASLYQWGLVPSWAKDTSIGQKLINARSETAAEKPSFRTALKRRRCLIPADGFYEWMGVKGYKQPYYITIEKHPFAFAGLWEYWEGVEGVVQSCTILTTSANEFMLNIHERMPVILSQDEYDLWLDPETPPPLVESLMNQYPSELMSMYPVSKAVGNPRFEDPSCIEKVGTTSLFE